MTANKKKFSIIFNLYNVSLIRSLNHRFRITNNLIYCKWLFCYEKRVIWLYFKGVISIYPKVCSFFTVFIFKFIVWIYWKMSLADYLSIKINWNRVRIHPLFLYFFLTAKYNSFFMWKWIFCSDFFIIRSWLMDD